MAGALGISVLVHLALLLVVFVTWPHLETWPRTEVTEVVLAPRPAPQHRAQRVTVPASPPTHRAPAAHPRRARPVPARHAPTVPGHPAAAAPRPATSPHPATAPPPAGARATPLASRAAPRAATAPPPSPQGTRLPATHAPPPGNARPMDLFAPEALAKATGTQAEFDGDPDALAKARITRRIHDYIAALKARDRVENGLVDPYFGRLRSRMAKGFKPTWTQFDPAHADGLGNAVVAWLKDWQATASRYALTGSPYHAGETYTDKIGPNELPELGTIGKDDGRVTLHQQALIHDYLRDAVHGKAGGMQLLTLVKVIQAGDGRLIHVEVTGPSGAVGYDAYVVRSVKQALKGKLPPKRRGTGQGLGRHHIVSLWAFRTRFVVVPPVPGGGCDIGTNLNSVGKCYYPLEKVVWPHLELVAVY